MDCFLGLPKGFPGDSKLGFELAEVNESSVFESVAFSVFWKVLVILKRTLNHQTLYMYDYCLCARVI